MQGVSPLYSALDFSMDFSKQIFLNQQKQLKISFDDITQQTKNVRLIELCLLIDKFLTSVPPSPCLNGWLICFKNSARSSALLLALSNKIRLSSGVCSKADIFPYGIRVWQALKNMAIKIIQIFCGVKLIEWIEWIECHLSVEKTL